MFRKHYTKIKLVCVELWNKHYQDVPLKLLVLLWTGVDEQRRIMGVGLADIAVELSCREIQNITKQAMSTKEIIQSENLGSQTKQAIISDW